MARRRGRNSGNNNSLLFLIIIGILIYLLFPRLQLNQEQNKSQNQSNETNLNTSNSENQAQYDIVAFVVGNTENSPAPEITVNKNISATLEDLFYSTEAGEIPNIVLFSATAEPKTIEIEKKYFLGQSANELASQSNFNDLLKGIEKAANSSPSCSGADYFAAINEALEYVKGYDNPLIIVYGSGLSDTGVFNFAFDDLITDSGLEKEHVDTILSSDNRFANESYPNVTVNWYGVGQTVGKQPELKEWKKSVENTYKAIFEYFNIVYKFYSIKVSSNTESVSSDYKVNITSLPIIEENYELSLDERYLSFYPNTAQLQNQPEVEQLLKSVVEKLNKNKSVKIKLTGYQTVCGKSKTLSIQRAETIKSIMVNLGISADRITTDGVAGPPDDRTEDPLCGSTGVAVEHRTVVLETYK
jgi:outer membrane protein OmpA-like peptidoglycan-associated protein/type II secretory pathway pseudopilin PulG